MEDAFGAACCGEKGIPHSLRPRGLAGSCRRTCTCRDAGDSLPEFDVHGGMDYETVRVLVQGGVTMLHVVLVRIPGSYASRGVVPEPSCVGHP